MSLQYVKQQARCLWPRQFAIIERNIKSQVFKKILQVNVRMSVSAVEGQNSDPEHHRKATTELLQNFQKKKSTFDR